MNFFRISNESPRYLPTIITGWLGVGIGALMNPFTANPLCHTASKMSPLIPLTLGGIGFCLNLCNAKLHSNLENVSDPSFHQGLLQHDIISEKLWQSTRGVSNLVSGTAMGASIVELAKAIFFCSVSSNILPTITTAAVIPFLAISFWNSVTVIKLKARSPIQTPHSRTSSITIEVRSPF
jgi:hypothetical protein